MGLEKGERASCDTPDFERNDGIRASGSRRPSSVLSMRDRCELLEERMLQNQVELEDRREIIDWALQRKREKDAALALLAPPDCSNVTDVNVQIVSKSFQSTGLK